MKHVNRVNPVLQKNTKNKQTKTKNNPSIKNFWKTTEEIQIILDNILLN